MKLFVRALSAMACFGVVFGLVSAAPANASLPKENLRFVLCASKNQPVSYNVYVSTKRSASHVRLGAGSGLKCRTFDVRDKKTSWVQIRNEASRSGGTVSCKAFRNGRLMDSERGQRNVASCSASG